MSKFIVTEQSLTDIANAIRSKTGGTDPLAFPDDFTDAIDGIVSLADGTADATATGNDIKKGKTAYANGAKVTGTYSPTVTNVAENDTVAGSFYVATGTHEVDEVVAVQKIPGNVIPDDNNIGITCDYSNLKFTYDSSAREITFAFKARTQVSSTRKVNYTFSALYNVTIE